VNDIDAYLRANHERFAREALDAKLREAGHDDAAIEAAWARMASDGSVVPGGHAPVGTGARIAAVVLIVVAIGAYFYVGAIGVIGLAFSASGLTGRPVGAVFSLGMVVYGIAMFVALAFAIRRIWRAPSLGRGASAIGGAVVVSLLVLVGINGVCFAGGIAASAIRGVLP
jgi:hypothetical protein